MAKGLEDLSIYHRPIRNGSPDTANSPARDLTPDQMSAFHGDGFLAGIRVLDEDQVDRLRSELELLLDPQHPGAHLFHERHTNESREPGRVLFHALGAWRISPAFHDLLWNPAILAPASQILDGPVRFWHDQLFVKPPHLGGVVSWHQDYSYWTRTEPMAHLTCWIPLDDVDEENGCPQYVPGSHRWRLLPITGLTGDMDAIREVLTPAELQAFRPRPALLRSGEATFHHPLTVHGSFQNRSTRPRRGIALNFCRDGTRSASDEPLLEGVPPIPRGQPLEGRFFPLLRPSARVSAT
jgi:ectoine hydroxylase-related dioxygenase (phytanoyl-CoA dioxygenase family)